MKAIKQAELNDILNSYFIRDEISASKVTELINDKADEFAIEFSLWKEDNAVSDDNGLYYGESRIGVSRENPIDIYQLLEIYKEQKQL